MKTGLLEHTPEDMTVTVEAGMTLAGLQTELARARQWLPVDPPHTERLTVGRLIDNNVSGPRRFGYGTIRDYLIGIKVAMADGSTIHSGGKVVKNVAGYDLMKLFIGAQGSLGTVLEATFKLRPLPESEKFVETECGSLEDADKLIEAVMQSEVTPIVLDLVSADLAAAGSGFVVVLGFAGTREEVEWQLQEAGKFGFQNAGSLDYETRFWSDGLPAQRLSVLPSKLVDALRGLNGGTFVARAGNGVIYHHGPVAKHRDELPMELMRRVKDAFDPKNILPKLPL
jgi:glycolate oxidase FAD binding subunit